MERKCTLECSVTSRLESLKLEYSGCPSVLPPSPVDLNHFLILNSGNGRKCYHVMVTS